jgi:hypothetical protein
MAMTLAEQFESGQVLGLDHNKLLELVNAGAIEQVTARGADGAWALTFAYHHKIYALTAIRSKELRRFARVDSVLSYLRDMGVSEFRVDVSGAEHAYNHSRRRPDLANAMRETHASAAEHKRWLEEALEAMDGQQTIPGDVVEARMAARRQRGA